MKIHTTVNPVEQFRDAIRSVGLEPPLNIEDFTAFLVLVKNRIIEPHGVDYFLICWVVHLVIFHQDFLVIGMLTMDVA